MISAQPRAVVFFADDPATAAQWWARALDLASSEVHSDGDFSWIEVDGIEIGFHPADPQRNPVGGSPVVYFATDGLDADWARLIALGATPHREPLTLSATRRIIQVRDPFGNVVGLDGPAR